MDTIILLTIGGEYNGHMYLYRNAEKSADLFANTIISKFQHHVNINHIKIRGSACNPDNICRTILSLSETECKRIIIYFSGHGDHIGNREFWQTPRGNIDQIKIAGLVNMLKPLVIVISDSCSSEHMVNLKIVDHPYISLGATLDNQDAMMTGDGGLFTIILSEIIDRLQTDFTIRDLFNEIMLSRVEIETFSVNHSHDLILDEKFIH